MNKPHRLQFTLFALIAALFSLLLGVSRASAQELSLLGGLTTRAGFQRSSYNYQLDYRQDLYRNFAGSFAYINEGHFPDHHRDGTAWEGWVNLPLFQDRIAFSLGGGVYYFYDTQSLPNGDTADVHGTAPIFSATATGYFGDRWFYRVMINRINPSHDAKVQTFSAGLGYWFGPDRRPRGAHPARDPVADGYVTEPQVAVFGGKSVVNTYFSESAWAGAAEYRQGILPHIDVTGSVIYEGDPRVIRRSGVAAQVWPVNTFLNDTMSVGFGIGPYIFIDRKHQRVPGSKNPAAIAPLVSLTFAKRLSDAWFVRVMFDRVTSTYNRDADIFLLGLGYAWRK